MSPYVDHCWSVDICSWVHGYYSMLYHDMRHCSCFTQSLFNYTVLALLLMTNPWKTLCWHPNGGKWQTAQPCSTSINGSMTRQNALFYNCILYPIGSMYGIYANIWGILMVNVSISPHGQYLLIRTLEVSGVMGVPPVILQSSWMTMTFYWNPKGGIPWKNPPILTTPCCLASGTGRVSKPPMVQPTAFCRAWRNPRSGFTAQPRTVSKDVKTCKGSRGRRLVDCLTL